MVLSAVLGVAFLALAFSGHLPSASIVKADPHPANTPPGCHEQNGIGGVNTHEDRWQPQSDKVSKLDTQAQANAECWSMHEPETEVTLYHNDPADVSLGPKGDSAKWEGTAILSVGREEYTAGSLKWDIKNDTQPLRIVVHRVNKKSRGKGFTDGFNEGATFGGILGVMGGPKGVVTMAIVGGVIKGGWDYAFNPGDSDELENKIDDSMTQEAFLKHDSSWEGGFLGVGQTRKDIRNSFAIARGHFSLDNFEVWHYSHTHATARSLHH